ncbi:MAG TPA: cation transporter [Octadecabacter sp.]|nr:cation transporter [Octadecabacter sp.]
MGHNHTHHAPADDRNLLWAIAVNLLLTVAQIIGGILSGSLALVADAIHNLSDAAALVIAFVARKISRRPASIDMPFGYARIETVAALINYTSLLIIGLYLAYEAVWRFFEPQPVVGWMMVIVAGIALLVDAITAALTYTMSKDSVNIRAAFLHNLADAAGSIAVIVAGVLILVFGWTLADPIITLMIAGYILWMSFNELPAVARTLMLARPAAIDAQSVVDRIKDIDGVTDVHHAYIWDFADHKAALSAHVVVLGDDWPRADHIKAQIKSALSDLHLVTLEMECAAHACTDAPTFGA